MSGNQNLLNERRIFLCFDVFSPRFHSKDQNLKFRICRTEPIDVLHLTPFIFGYLSQQWNNVLNDDIGTI